MTNLPLSELEAALKKATPGPWRWFVRPLDQGVYLATVDRGRQVVMDFVRWGMSRAAPRFQRDARMVRVEEFVSPDRYGEGSIDHPDAALIVLLRNNADALVEAAKKAEELEVAHELSGQRYANAIELWGEKKALAEESARKLAEAEREVEMLRALFAGAEEQHAELQAKFFALQAENAKLREALQRIANREEPVPGLAPTMYGHAVRIAQEALSSPPKSAGTKEDEHVG